MYWVCRVAFGERRRIYAIQWCSVSDPWTCSKSMLINIIIILIIIIIITKEKKNKKNLPCLQGGRGMFSGVYSQ